MRDYDMVVTAPGASDRFERREIGSSAPGPGEGLVRRTAVGLNFPDVYDRSGLSPWAVKRDLIPGSEAAGRVAAGGTGVWDVKARDRVA